MHSDLVGLGWTEEQWSRIVRTTTEEAQKNRVGAQVFGVSGPEDPTTVAVPNFTLGREGDPHPPHPNEPPRDRLDVDSYPTLWLTTLSINVALHAHEVADADLKAALVMFRRAANYIARLEDVLIFNGRDRADALPAQPAIGIPDIYRATGQSPVQGIFFPDPRRPDGRHYITFNRGAAPQQNIVTAIVNAIDQLDAAGQLGPYACILGHTLFNDACTPTANLVLPRDRILPFLDGGPLVRSSTILPTYGAVVALSGNPIEVVIARDLAVTFLQASPEPRYIFRVSEKVAPRIKEDNAIAVLRGIEGIEGA